MYIRTVRVHKVISEVLYKCLLNKMEENHADNFESSSIISDVQEKVNDFYENITQCSNHDFIEKDCNNYKLYLEDSSDLTKFWLTYFTVVHLLLNTLYATRTGDWELLGLDHIRDLARYAFANDRYKMENT